MADFNPYAALSGVESQQGIANAFQNSYNAPVNAQILQNQAQQGQLANQATALTNQYIPQVQQANIAQTQASAAAQQAAAKQQQIQNLYDQHNLEGNFLSQVNPDGSNYGQIYAAAAKSGLDVSQLPDPTTANPAQIAQALISNQAQWIKAQQWLDTYKTNVESAKLGLGTFNPQNPQATVQPSFGDAGKSAFGLTGPELDTVTKNNDFLASSQSTLRNLNNAMNLTKSGSTFTGPGGAIQQAAARTIDSLAPGLEAIPAVKDYVQKGTNTTAFNNEQATQLASQISDTLGGKATDADKAFLAKLVAAPSLDAPEQQRVIQQAIDRLNDLKESAISTNEAIRKGKTVSAAGEGILGKVSPSSTVITPQGQVSTVSGQQQNGVPVNLQPGQIYKGHVYLGGPKNNPASWKPIKASQ